MALVSFWLPLVLRQKDDSSEDWIYQPLSHSKHRQLRTTATASQADTVHILLFPNQVTSVCIKTCLSLTLTFRPGT